MYIKGGVVTITMAPLRAGLHDDKETCSTNSAAEYGMHLANEAARPQSELMAHYLPRWDETSKTRSGPGYQSSDRVSNHPLRMMTVLLR